LNLLSIENADYDELNLVVKEMAPNYVCTYEIDLVDNVNLDEIIIMKLIEFESVQAGIYYVNEIDGVK
jgi:hypothetical protein